ncbi:MFS transporter [Chloroflexota bacterium]
MKTNLKQMYGIGILAFFLFLSTLVGVPVLPALSMELGAASTKIPVVVSAALATVVIAQFFTGILADRYSKKTLVLTGALIGSISSLLCVVATHWVQLAVLRVIGGIADAIAMPALLVMTASLGEDQPGKFFGILRGSQGLSFAVGPALGSLFSLISLRTPFIADGLLSLVAFGAAFILLSDREKAVSEHDLSLFRGLKSTFSSNRVYLYLLMGISGFFAWSIQEGFIPTKSHLIGLEAWQIGLIITAGALVFSLVSFSIGSLSDRFGRKLFVVLSQVIMIGSIIGLIYGNSFVTLLLFFSVFVLVKQSPTCSALCMPRRPLTGNTLVFLWLLLILFWTSLCFSAL